MITAQVAGITFVTYSHMTKKHYEQIASILKRELELMPYSDMYELHRNIVYALATYMEKENPRFQRERFLTACGIEQNGLTDEEARAVVLASIAQLRKQKEQECTHGKEYQQANKKGGWDILCRHCGEKISEIA